MNIEDELLGDPKLRAVVDVALAREKITAAVAAARNCGLPRFIVNVRANTTFHGST